MHVHHSVSGEIQTFRFSKGFKPVPVAIAALSASAVAQIGLVLMAGDTKIVLIGLLMAVALCCIMLAAISMEELLSSEIVIKPEELTWSSLLTNRTVEWRQTLPASLVGADGSFSTTTLEKGIGPVGIGMTVMSSSPNSPEEQVVMVAGPQKVADAMMRAIEAINQQRRQSTSAQPAARSSRRIAKPIVPAGEFRRRPSQMHASN
jgi:hypothetical protein